MQPPVIVLGMHRSGTSLLAGCLQAAGLYLGKVNDSAPFNAKGNKENESIRHLHDQVLSRHGLDWITPGVGSISWSAQEKEQLTKLLVSYGDVDGPWGFKDPRAVWLLDYWLELFPQARLIAVFRHPSLVVRSLTARTGSLQLSKAEAIELWCNTNQKILELRKTVYFPLLHFSDSLNLEKYFFHPLTLFCKEIGLTSDPSIFFDKSLVNQTYPQVVVPKEVAELYQRLIELRSTAA